MSRLARGGRSGCGRAGDGPIDGAANHGGQRVLLEDALPGRGSAVATRCGGGCWGRHGADKPVCYIATGLLQESLKWVSGGKEFRVNESKCIGAGDEACEFVIQKEPIP